MALLAGTLYDPGTAVTKATDTLIPMTALDTTNLRLTFAAPANGKVLVRLRCVLHGATTWAQILLGVMDGATVKGRQAPIGSLKGSAQATGQLTQEALFLVTGLTPAASYTWDAAYGVETVVAATGIKYGGPNDTTTNNAFGGFSYEIWETPTLLAGTLYDPGTAATVSTTALIGQTALDTTNLRLTFTAPASGAVLVRMRGVAGGSTAFPQITFGVLDGATVKGRQSPLGGLLGTGLATTRGTQEASFLVTGLTPTTSYTWDASYGVEVTVVSTSLRWGGPNDTTGDNAHGGFSYEIWRA